MITPCCISSPGTRVHHGVRLIRLMLPPAVFVAALIPPAGERNAAWPQSSWAVTEPGIYYQSAYVELPSRFAQ